MDISTRTCRVCGKSGPADQFAPGRNKCKPCHNAWHRDYFASSPEQREKRKISSARWQKTNSGLAATKEKNLKYYAAHREERVANVRVWCAKLWDGLLEKYGSVCVCCGETQRLFLTIDHVNRNGAEDRAKHGGHRPLYYWMSQQPRLPDYQVLCYNCNCGRERNGGICPHERGLRLVKK